MKHQAFLLFLILIACACASDRAMAREPPAGPELEQEIRVLDLAHAKAIFESDARALDALMDDEVTVNHPTNRIVKEKQELLDLIGEGVIRYTAFERHPEGFLFFKDMVVVMGNEAVVPAPGAPNAGKTLQRRYTNVWMRRDGRWRLTIRHANNVCTECAGRREEQLQRSPSAVLRSNAPMPAYVPPTRRKPGVE